MYFEYGEKEIEYLKSKDKVLAGIIEKIGPIEREINPDLFSTVIHNIVGQQISSKALETVWGRIKSGLGEITPNAVFNAGAEKLQSFGISFRKAEYISDFARKVKNGEFDLDKIRKKSDEEAIAQLVSLKGIGVWTAEMILLFCLGRPNIFSCDDFGIKKGLRMVYRHKEITKHLAEKYKKRFTPYGSTASLYFWAVAGGAIPELKDFPQKKKSRS